MDTLNQLKERLNETITDYKENQAEIDSGHRPRCDDGSDEILEALADYASGLLSQIEEKEVSK